MLRDTPTSREVALGNTKRRTPPSAAAKLSPPRNLTPGLCQRLKRELLQACNGVAASHGLVAELGGVADIDLRHGFNISFRVGIPMADGALFSHEKAIFEALAPSFGLEASDYGRTFTTAGDVFRLTAINPNRPRYPISAERVADGRAFKFSAEDVAMYLKNAQ